MPYDRFKKLNKEKRNHIMETALNEFIEKNFEAASINQISKNAKLSSGALYYYFEDKEDLFYTTVDYVSSSLWNNSGNIEDFFNNYGYWEGIKELVKRRLKLTISHPKYVKLFHRMLSSNDPVELKGRKLFISPFKNVFEYGYNNGHIRTDLPKDLVFNIHLSIVLAVNKWSLDQQFPDSQNNVDLEELSCKTIDMIKAAISHGGMS